jgi:probable rRNA maturation factor
MRLSLVSYRDKKVSYHNSGWTISLSTIRTFPIFTMGLPCTSRRSKASITLLWLAYLSFHQSTGMSLLQRSFLVQRNRIAFCRRLANQQPAISSFRLFGSSPTSSPPPTIPPSIPSHGEIYIENDQTDLALDLEKLKQTIHDIRKLLKYEPYGVSLLLIDDAEMKRVNKETRGVNGPTDILSFPMLEAVTPGNLQKPDFPIAEYYNLGDMLVDVPYVIRRCREDEADQAEAAAAEAAAVEEGAQSTIDELADERGVSGAMATVYDPQVRVQMLLIHGMLHLVGHDHEDDDEYEIMVQEEERILRELNMLPDGK